jgi:hypothetical protein
VSSVLLCFVLYISNQYCQPTPGESHNLSKVHSVRNNSEFEQDKYLKFINIRTI